MAIFKIFIQQAIVPAQNSALDEDQEIASAYSPPSFPVLTIGSELQFQQVEDDVCAKWLAVDNLCSTHLSCLWQRLVILKTVRDLWAYSSEPPSDNSPEALSRFEENLSRTKFFAKIDDSVLGVPVRVLDAVARQFLRLSEHWDSLCAPPEVKVALNARALKLSHICKKFYR